MWMIRKKQCTWTKLWSWFGAYLEVVEVDTKDINEKNVKKELKNYVFPFRMIMQKFCTVMRNGPKRIFFTATQREISKLISHDHAKISHDHAKILHDHAKCSRKTKLVLMHFLLRTIMWNCWISCEMGISLLNSKFFGEEASRNPLR